MCGENRQPAAWGALALALVLSACAAPPPEPVPTPWANDKAEVEVTHLADWGTVTVRYTGAAPAPVKLQITRDGGEDYNYDLDAAGAEETFAFTEGNGSYTLRVLEHLEGDRYTPVFTQQVEVDLAEETAPFLHPNQFVNYTPDSAAAEKAARLAQEAQGPALAAAVLQFVAETLTYDQEKAETVDSGYLPDVDQVLAEGKGICFDYAALMAAMLRSQGVPCKLAVGYAGTTYHAWVEVWSAEAGTAEGLTFQAGWTRLDPTFVSTRGLTGEMAAYMAQDGNYQTEYVY